MLIRLLFHSLLSTRSVAQLVKNEFLVDLAASDDGLVIFRTIYGKMGGGVCSTLLNSTLTLPPPIFAKFYLKITNVSSEARSSTKNSFSAGYATELDYQPKVALNIWYLSDRRCCFSSVCFSK